MFTGTRLGSDARAFVSVGCACASAQSDPGKHGTYGRYGAHGMLKLSIPYATARASLILPLALMQPPLCVAGNQQNETERGGVNGGTASVFRFSNLLDEAQVDTFKEENKLPAD